MKQDFTALPEEKQKKLIDAALYVFSRSTYKKASTDEIVARAGISKGLLFYYFGNKQGLYLFLYQYASTYLAKEMSAYHNYAETDFFRILSDAQMCKIMILSTHPDLMRFLVQAHLEEDPSISAALNKNFAQLIADSSSRFLARADTSRFQGDVSPEQVLNLILWMSDGFMRSRTPEQLADLPALNAQYLSYLDLLKRKFYKSNLD